MRTIIRNEFEEALKEVDALVAPTTTSTAPASGQDAETDPVDAYRGDILTVPINLAGLPALSIPAGFSEKLPVGIQLIGNYFEESTLYQIGHAFEQATDHHQQFPTLEGGTTE